MLPGFVAVPAVASAAVIAGPSMLPGSTAGNVELHAGKVVVPPSMGRLIAWVVPHGLVVDPFEVNGMLIPPTGIPVPACCRSSSMEFNPARKFSVMSAACVTSVLDCVAERNVVTAAYN